MLIRSLLACFTILSICGSRNEVWSQGVYDSPESAASNPDFMVQGEYVGAARAMQVVALGDDEFDVVVFAGGLPGAGWDGAPPRTLSMDAKEVLESARNNGFQRIERKSPTLGLRPPAGAVVLFDGSSESLTAHWNPGAKATDDGLLMQGATSTDLFESYTIHLEFRTPFMPAARGQGRGNSGLYHQGRYETQILDSFGLEGQQNETGGLYSIKAPDLNMCLPPLAWQTYDVDYTAAKFADGQKVANPRITVRVNGVVVQQDIELPHSTTAAPVAEGASAGPIYLQDHGNPVRFRNIWVKPRDLEQERKRPRVVGFERFHAVGDPSALGGRLLIHELGCVSCHALDALTDTRQAPILDSVGGRIRPDHLLAFIAQPHVTKPGTTMPDILAGYSEADRVAAAEALTSFLMSTGDTVDRRGDPRAVRRGEQIYHSIGCTACHAPQNEIQVGDATSIPLGDLSAKYTLDSLSGFLGNPHAIRPSGRMPNFGLSPEQVHEVATYLLRDVVVGQGALNMQASFYEGSWDELPDFGKLKPYSETETYDLDILASGRTENFAARFDTTIVIPESGRYRFFLNSDDGSRLFIDGELQIEHDGVHPNSVKQSGVRLAKGNHALRVEYFEKGGEEVLGLDIEGDGLVRTSISNLATLDPGAAVIESFVETKFVAKPELVERGKDLFMSAGCAACHDLNLGGAKLLSTAKDKPFAALDFNRGCMSADATAGVPNYDLSDAQRASILLAAEELKTTPAMDDKAHVRLSMASFNCYACHSRDGLGGPEPTRDAVFGTTMKEMGDEGRVPPPLNGVGDKLRKDYVQKILAEGANERDYMLVNMPGFGAENLKQLADRFARLDEKTTADVQPLNEPHAKLISDGRLLVGEKGLSCVKCHTFGGQGAPGIGAIDLQRMTTRLREDWFHRYLMSPTTYRPGTRMPASFPEGKSVLPDLYGGRPNLQIAAMWDYLSDGADAREPIGVQQQLIELVPNQRPTIYRNFIEGLTPRGIAVGYPEQGNVAWDANRLSLSLLWKGAFIDASKHWVGRGPGTQGPLGDELLDWERAAPLAKLDDIKTAWPTQTARELGNRFLGYRLDAGGQPTFRYEIAGALVEEKPIPVTADGKLIGFDRAFEVKDAVSPLVFRAARGERIATADDSWYQIDGRAMVKLDSQTELVQVDGKDGKMELRASLPAGNSRWKQQIRW